MTGGIILTGARMRCAPVAGKNLFTTAALVNDGVDCEAGSDHRSHTVAFIAHRITSHEPGTYSFAAASVLEIKRQHVRGFNGFASGQTRTDRFAPTGKAREIMKANRAGENYLVEFFQRAIDLDRRAPLSNSELDQLRRIMSVVIDGANTLRDEGREQF